MDRCCCPRSVHRIKRFILHRRGSRRPHWPMRRTLQQQPSDHLTREVTQTQNQSRSRTTTSHLTLVQCLRCARQSHSHPIKRGEPPALILMAKHWANMAFRRTVSFPPTFLRQPMLKQKHSSPRTSTKSPNAHRRHSRTPPSWMI
jgi:hypothetical protein